MVQQFSILGLLCPDCEKVVEDFLMGKPGITRVVADMDIKTLLIFASRRVKLSELREALKLIGDFQVSYPKER